MSYDVGTHKLSARDTAVVRLTSLPAGVGAAVGQVLPEIEAVLDRQRIAAAGPPFARFFDYTDEEADFEAGFPVGAAIAPDGRVQPAELPGGRAAVTVHHGPYEELQRAHDAVGEWVLSNRRDTFGPVWEVYATGPWQESDPARFETEVVWPLRG